MGTPACSPIFRVGEAKTYLLLALAPYGRCSPNNHKVIAIPPYERDSEANMATGTVKWFNVQKGYGFIQPDDGSKDVFVHISAVQQAGMRDLQEGQKLRYEAVAGRQGKISAENLQVT